jgi:arginase
MSSTRAIKIAGDGTAGIHLSFDLDVLDPEDAPGTGTPVRGGITYREAHLAMEMLSDRAQVVAIDLVEVNRSSTPRTRPADPRRRPRREFVGKRIL